MSWYEKYLKVFEQPFELAPSNIIKEVSDNLRRIQSDNPLASVVVLGYNEEKRLLSCLWSLSENKCDYPIEIIGVNNNSIDRTAEVFDAAGVKWFFEEKKSCGYARRCGLEHAKGKYYICIDADTLYPPHYLQTVIAELQKPGIVGVSTLWSFIPDAQNPRAGLYFYEFLRNIHIRLLAYNRPELSVRGMVFSYVAEYGRKVGYRVELKRGEDGSMALGLKKYGKLKLLTSRKIRVVTSTGTLNAEGPLWRNFKIRLFRFLKGLGSYFSKRSVYEDKSSNLVEPLKSDTV